MNIKIPCLSKIVLFFHQKIWRRFKSTRVPLFSTDFMSAWAWHAPNGDIYTAVKTAPAVVVLPYIKTKEEGCRVVLISQYRPEQKRSVLKTIGGYIGETETAERAVVRNLDNKIGLRIKGERLIPDGRMLGYTVVEIPITIYRVEISAAEVEKILAVKLPDIDARLILLDEAIHHVKDGQVGDDSTALALYKLHHDLASVR